MRHEPTLADATGATAPLETNEASGTRRRPASHAKKKAPKPGGEPLLAAICHDLRAPLAAVTMGASFVLQTATRAGADPRSVKILGAMLRSCTQMERLIRNLSDLSQIEGKSVVLRMGLHDPGEMLELAAASARESALARRVTLDVNKPDERLSLNCDRERLLRAIGHVVENAVKHAPEGSTVTLAALPRGNALSFSIIDRGAGLTAQVRRHLFDRNWHAKRANRVGAGFGLAITRGFVLAHGGRLRIESRPVEQTTFSLEVPKDGPRKARGKVTARY